MKTADDVLKAIKDKDVKYVDCRFTDPRGKWQHVTFDVSIIDADTFSEGLMFDGSSIAGWKAINELDMCLMPDPTSAVLDPFFAAPTMSIVCDVLEPTTGEPYNRDPRGIAKRAEAYMASTGVGDTVYFGPEAEFFVFDDVRFAAEPYNTGFVVDSIEFPSNTDTTYEGGNLGHRIRTKGGYFPVPPQDSAQDMRSEMLAAMAAMGAGSRKAPPRSGLGAARAGPQIRAADQIADHLQIYKYCIHQVAQSYGKTATFMPKPIYGDNGSGMHVHQSIWKGGKPLFAGNKYSDLSDECLYLHRRDHPACAHARTPSPIRRPIPTSAWCRASRRRFCSLIRRATAPPPAASPIRRTRRPSASRCASPIPPPIPISLSRRC